MTEKPSEAAKYEFHDSKEPVSVDPSQIDETPLEAKFSLI
jgi:hypothetical protein